MNTLGLGLIGSGGMGKAHAQACRAAPPPTLRHARLLIVGGAFGTRLRPAENSYVPKGLT
ncbi:hypothetical protein [Phaeobacter sp. B1627]|uniref:hypothetical protein n=1 Tax=Phaeobacter sp. B1627 TaxID=2583809 RepID=UPI001119096A|nr:hypothetical protein [Phaeobacter sp. B1627]TNJ39741.1 hypothetical protein FGE21_18680 [Phaeobacter sp. B1627]